MVAANRRFESSWFSNRSSEQSPMPTMEDIKQSARSTFEASPVGVTFAAFGLGFVFGMAVAMMLTEGETSHRMWS